MKGDKRASGQPPASPASKGSSLPSAARPAGAASATPAHPSASLPNRILGSLRDALNAASREDRSGEISLAQRDRSQQAESSHRAAGPAPAVSKAADGPGAAGQRDGRATREERHVELGDPTRDRAGERAAPRPAEVLPSAPARTRALRGKAKVAHNAFYQDPVVGWLVVVGGAGLGAFRPIYEGNNSIGRGRGQRIPIDFGDDTISTEEQAYIRYDSVDRSFLFVPNLSKTNIVAVNDKKPTGAVKLELMDVITMGRTQLAFVPFCGEDFDWSELSDLKE
jgi:hypothetical protein